MDTIDSRVGASWHRPVQAMASLVGPVGVDRVEAGRLSAWVDLERRAALQRREIGPPGGG